MLLQFGNDFCSACESNTGVWHEGNDRVGCSSTPKVIDVDLYACKDPHHQLAQVYNCRFTHSASCIDCAIVQGNVMCARENMCSAHVEP